MSGDSEIEKYLKMIADLEKHLQETAKYQENLVNYKQSMDRHLNTLNENLRFLQRKGVVSLIEEYSKVSKHAKKLQVDIVQAQNQLNGLAVTIKTQTAALAQQRQLLHNATEKRFGTVVKFERKKI